MRAGARAHRAGQESEGVYIKPEVAHATSYAAQPTLSGEGRNTSKPRARSARPSVMLSRLCGRISTGISCYHHQMHLLYSHRPNLPTGQIRAREKATWVWICRPSLGDFGRDSRPRPWSARIRCRASKRQRTWHAKSSAAWVGEAAAGAIAHGGHVMRRRLSQKSLA